MSATKRAGKEFDKLSKEGVPEGFESVVQQGGNPLIWECVCTPSAAPYDKHKFTFTITLPPDYPFKPPKVKFTPAIYHPNFSEGGEPCLTIINADKWKPATKIKDVFPALLSMVNEAELSHPIRADLAEKYVSDRAGFDKAAYADATKQGLPGR